MNQPVAAAHPDTTHEQVEVQPTSILRWSFATNLFIVVLLLIAYANPPVGYACGVVVIGLLSIQATRCPKETLFFIFGIKLTLDLMWWVPPPDAIPVPLKITHLSFAPLALCLASGLVRQQFKADRIAIAGAMFVAWCALVQLANSDARINPEIFLRVSGSLIGYLVGASFISSRQDLTCIVKLALISTLVPLIAALVQIFATLLDTPIFFYTLGSTRGARFAGLNHDSGGLGLVALVGLLSAIYLLYSNSAPTRFTKYLYWWIGLSFFVLTAGGTRSIFVVSAAVVLTFFVMRLNKGLKLLPFVIAALWFAYPYVAKMQAKSLSEIRYSGVTSRTSVNDLLTDRKYNTLLTGRMRLWQFLYREHSRASPTQKLLGTGRTTDAHSTYFFLLLYVGKLGLLTFLVFNFLMLHAVYRARIDIDMKYVSVASLGAFLLMGISLTTILYTSFQWMLYLLIGGSIRIGQESSSSTLESRSDS